VAASFSSGNTGPAPRNLSLSSFDWQPDQQQIFEAALCSGRNDLDLRLRVRVLPGKDASLHGPAIVPVANAVQQLCVDGVSPFFDGEAA